MLSLSTPYFMNLCTQNDQACFDLIFDFLLYFSPLLSVAMYEGWSINSVPPWR